MKALTLKRSGWGLLFLGGFGACITAAEMVAIKADAADSSPEALAEAISGTLGPAVLGAVLVLVGGVMLVVGWLRGRKGGV